MNTANDYEITSVSGGRYVVHFLAIADTDHIDGPQAINNAYRRACNHAADYGGKRYHNRSYGGGVAFQSLDQLTECVNDAITDPWLSMRHITVEFDDGSTIETNINGTRKSINEYYIGTEFNRGDTEEHPADKMITAINVIFH